MLRPEGALVRVEGHRDAACDSHSALLMMAIARVLAIVLAMVIVVEIALGGASASGHGRLITALVSSPVVTASMMPGLGRVSPA